MPVSMAVLCRVKTFGVSVRKSNTITLPHTHRYRVWRQHHTDNFIKILACVCVHVLNPLCPAEGCDDWSKLRHNVSKQFITTFLALILYNNILSNTKYLTFWHCYTKLWWLTHASWTHSFIFSKYCILLRSQSLSWEHWGEAGKHTRHQITHSSTSRFTVRSTRRILGSGRKPDNSERTEHVENLRSGSDLELWASNATHQHTLSLSHSSCSHCHKPTLCPVSLSVSSPFSFFLYFHVLVLFYFLTLSFPFSHFSHFTAPLSLHPSLFILFNFSLFLFISYASTFLSILLYFSDSHNFFLCILFFLPNMMFFFL